MKKKIALIMITSLVVMFVGMSVAYYNTRTFGFDENAKLFSKDDEKISFMDFDIYYKNLESFVEQAKQVLPMEYIPV